MFRWLVVQAINTCLALYQHKLKMLNVCILV